MQYLKYLKKTNNKKAFSLLELSLAVIVIALVIASLTKGSSLVQKYRLNSARILSFSSDINNIEGLLLWLDATKEGSIINDSGSDDVSDGDIIKTWKSVNSQKDKTINFNQDQEEYANQRPSFTASAINNLPAIFFTSDYNDKDHDNLQLDHQISLSPVNFTIFVVTRPSKTNNFSGGLLSFQGSNKVGYGLFKKDTSNAWLFSTGDNEDNEVENSNFLLNERQIITSIRDNDSIKIYHNGTLSNSKSSSYIINHERDSKFYIGRGYDGYISEIIIFKHALNDEDRQDVESYLGQKYDIDTNYGEPCNGFVVDGICQKRCGINVTGSSIIIVNSGSSYVNCDQTGYIGTASYTCDDGVISSVESCSCADSYHDPLNNGVCEITTCNINENGLVAEVDHSNGTVQKDCNQPGYQGLISYTCDKGNITEISGSCSCADGYHDPLNNGVCEIITCNINENGIDVAVNHGSDTVNCNEQGYQGLISYTCDKGNITEISGSCSCASGYALSNNGVCEITSCEFEGVTGIRDGTIVDHGSGSISCNENRYASSVSYNCSNGDIEITSNNCYERCSVANHEGVTGAPSFLRVGEDHSGQCNGSAYNDTWTITCTSGQTYTSIKKPCQSCAPGYGFNSTYGKCFRACTGNPQPSQLIGDRSAPVDQIAYFQCPCGGTKAYRCQMGTGTANPNGGNWTYWTYVAQYNCHPSGTYAGC